MNDIFERNHPMKDDKEFITSYWADRAHDFGALRAKELESPKLKLWREELTCHIFDSDRSLRILDVEPAFLVLYYLSLVIQCMALILHLI